MVVYMELPPGIESNLGHKLQFYSSYGSDQKNYWTHKRVKIEKPDTLFFYLGKLTC